MEHKDAQHCMQSIGGMTASTAVGCNVSGTGITITDRRIFIIINGTDTTEQIAEAIGKALAAIATSHKGLVLTDKMVEVTEK